MKRPVSSARLSAAPAPLALTDEEAFDLKCIRYRNDALAAQGCGEPHCSLETCAVARHARLVLRALEALSPRPAHARSHAAPKRSP